MATQLLRHLLIPASILVWTAAGANPSDRASDEGVPLPENERMQITLDLLDRYPELASSPGIKFAEAPLDRDGMVGIRVFFYPHAESRGIKEAFRASCAWENSSHTWRCYNVVIRRYLTLASQNFEVRVNGDIAADAALALIEASRRDLEAILPNDPDRPDTATMIKPSGDGYAIAWGTSDGYSKLGMIAQLSEGGDPTNPDDWQASIY